VFSTFHGGDRHDDAQAVAVDSQGYIYVTGRSESRDLAAAPLGGKPLTLAVSRGYLTKYSPNGKDLIWRLLIGGSANTTPTAVAVDGEGNVFVAGSTEARDLPLKNPIQDRHTSSLAICFLMKLSPRGELLYSTLFGGEKRDDPRALAVDSTGHVYMAGRVTSTTFPVKNALQPKLGGNDDGFIAKFTPELQLAYSTYLGGTGSDHILALAAGPDDSVYVTGESSSPGLATAGAYTPLVQPYSSFAARISGDGRTLHYFTYVGWRGGYSTARAIAVDNSGQPWIGGDTTSKQLPVSSGAIQTSYAGGMRDGFLLRLAHDGKTATYLSYLGGTQSGPTNPDESVTALRVDRRGHLHIAGHTNSRDFPGRRVLQREHGGAYDAFAVRLAPELEQFVYATTWGGARNDGAQAVALGPGEAVTIVGESFSPDLPIANAVQSRAGSNNDAFLAQFCDPWLETPEPAVFRFVTGGDLPAALQLAVTSGCVQPFAATVAVDQPWLKIGSETGTAPMTIEASIDPQGLEPGTYRAVITVTVPSSFQGAVSIPVVLEITDPPAGANAKTRHSEPPPSPAEVRTVVAGKETRWVDVMGGEMPGIPEFSPLQPEPGKVRGQVKDWSGMPLAGAEIGIRVSYLAGSYTVLQGRTDANGYYEISLPNGTAQFYNAGYRIEWGTGAAAVSLHPADGSLESFVTGDGAVENFVLLPHGTASRENLQSNAHLPSAFYGGAILFDWYGVEAGDENAPPFAVQEDTVLEIVLTPEGRMLDGSTGRRIAIRKTIGASGGFRVHNIPLGRYRLSVYANGKELKIADVENSGQPFGLTPAVAIGEAGITFAPETANAATVAPQQGAWKWVRLNLQTP